MGTCLVVTTDAARPARTDEPAPAIESKESNAMTTIGPQDPNMIDLGEPDSAPQSPSEPYPPVDPPEGLPDPDDGPDEPSEHHDESAD